MVTLNELLSGVERAVPDGARPHGAPLARCGAALAALPGVARERPLAAFFVPGRIELFGKHTDYAGGRSLLAALERGFRVAAVPREDNLVRVRALDIGGDALAEFPLDGNLEPRAGHWSNYPLTVARRLARNFAAPGRPLCGADLALTSDLPPAAGLSSSSALIVAVYLALAEVNRLDQGETYRAAIRSREDLATYLACIENGRSFGPLAGDRGVGTFGGSEDHTIILAAREGHLSQFSFCPARHEADVAWPGGLVLAVACSGIVAEKTGARLADYNRLAEQARAMVEAFNEARGTVCRTLRECVEALGPQGVPLEHFFSHLVALRRELAALDLPGRALQFRVEDQELVPRAAAAVQRGSWRALAGAAERSHELADACLRNQTAETNGLVQLARRCGAVASSAFGAGFGGSVWAAVRAEEAEGFLARWQQAYGRGFPDAAGRAVFFTTRPAGAARVLLDCHV